MKTIQEYQVGSAYLDSDGSLHLYDDDENHLEGWPVGWPEEIKSVRLFLESRGINYVNKPRSKTMLEKLIDLHESKSQPNAGALEGKTWIAECDVCGKRYKNGCGSTPCCGSLQHVVDESKLDWKDKQIAGLEESLVAAKERIKTLKLGLQDAVNGIQEWCDDVDKDASWDGWDSNFKHWKYEGLDKLRSVLNPKA